MSQNQQVATCELIEITVNVAIFIKTLAYGKCHNYKTKEGTLWFEKKISYFLLENALKSPRNTKKLCNTTLNLKFVVFLQKRKVTTF